MKLHLVITIFLFIITSITNALKCIDADKPIGTLNSLGLSAVRKAINNLNITDKYDKCLVEIYIDYLHPYTEVSFGTTFESSYLVTNREVRVDFLIDLTKDETTINPASIYNILEFACDYTDECDRHFVLNHLEWLFKATYVQLESAIRPLLMTDDDNKGKNIISISKTKDLSIEIFLINKGEIRKEKFCFN
jgi:hypothetical protein